MDRLARYRGSLLGLAVGDALGTTLEFRAAGSFDPLTDIVGGGPFGLHPGEWTDDTSMALCLATSLIRCKGFDPVDQLQRYLRWYREGYLSSTGECFDIGNTIRQALLRFEKTGESYPGSSDPYSAGNGSIMRLAPVPLYYAAKPAAALARCADSSRTTHATRAAVDACRYFGGLILGAILGAPKDRLLSPMYSPVKDYWKREPLCTEIAEIALGSYKKKSPPEIIGSGYVVKSLEAALWAFHTTGDFEHGCLRAVNLGNDADTTGAVYGQLAGSYYGEQGIPLTWRRIVALHDVIAQLAEQLYLASYSEACGNKAGSPK